MKPQNVNENVIKKTNKRDGQNCKHLYWDLDKNNKKLEKVNQQLLFQKGIDDEVRDILKTQHAEFNAAWDEMKGKWFEHKLEEMKKDTGCEVIITRVTSTGSQRVEDLTGIHISMMAHLKMLKDQAKQVKITKIEYILNDKLHEQFKRAKEELKKAGRTTDEIILFHGTESNNIESYLPFRAPALIHSILSEGFRIGGIDGFMPSHGSSMVSSHLSPLSSTRDG